MIAMTGIWLLVALADGSQVGLKAMPDMATCQAQAATYRAQPAQYARVECVGNPVVGSASVFQQPVVPSELLDVFSKILHGVGQ